MIKPNLPDKAVKTAIVSCDISPCIAATLLDLNINPVFIKGSMNCDSAIKNHTDIYVMHYSSNKLFIAKNNCSINGEALINYDNIKIDLLKEIIEYPDDASLNFVSLGRSIICNTRYAHPYIIRLATQDGYNIINVNQGYTKCNICIVDENSVITEDVGINNTLTKVGFNVLLLENKIVRLKGYKYGFIGGASGKIDSDKLAFFGNIKLHPEYDRIRRFLYKRDVRDVSLSDDPLTDYGSLIPVE